MAADGPAWSLNGEHHGERLPSIHDLPGGLRLGDHGRNTASLDAALAEIEKHTRGVCRRNPEVVADFRRPEFCVSGSRATIHLSVYPPHLHR